MKVLGGQELVDKGISSIAQLRPVLAGNASEQEQLVGNATLREDEWKSVDDRVNQVLRERLTVADDLRAKGLVANVSLGTILRVTEHLSDFDAADLSYDGDTAPTADRPDFGRNVVPVPVISKDFTINWRQLDASRKRGEPLDVTAAGIAARKVRDRLQAVITNGYGLGPGANPASGTDGQFIPGLTTAPNRQTVSLDTPWDQSGADIVGDVQRMLEAAYAVNLFGPFGLYVPKNYWGVLQADYSALKGDRTFLQRLEAFADVEMVRPLDALAEDNVVLVQLTEDVIDLSEAQVVTTVQWQKSPFVTQFRVLTVAGPQIKSIKTSGGSTVNGIVHLS